VLSPTSTIIPPENISFQLQSETTGLSVRMTQSHPNTTTVDAVHLRGHLLGWCTEGRVVCLPAACPQTGGGRVFTHEKPLNMPENAFFVRFGTLCVVYNFFINLYNLLKVNYNLF